MVDNGRCNGIPSRKGLLIAVVIVLFFQFWYYHNNIGAWYGTIIVSNQSVYDGLRRFGINVSIRYNGVNSIVLGYISVSFYCGHNFINTILFLIQNNPIFHPTSNVSLIVEQKKTGISDP